ncbi:hypothetical protein, partial [Paracoccus niistensis]
LTAPMIAVKVRVQREGEVVHLVVYRITDMSRELGTVGQRDGGGAGRHGRRDEFYDGSPGPDPRACRPAGPLSRDMYVRDLHLDALRVNPRDFR